MEDLLPVQYFHVVLTLPSQIADIAYQNKGAVYGLLFKASSETLRTIAVDPKHLGAKIGMTSVLHTLGSVMTHHPHVHVVVLGGGLSLEGKRWVDCRKGFLVSVKVLSRLFRRLFLEGLAKLQKEGKLAACQGWLFPMPSRHICSILDDHIDPRHYAFFMARSVLRDIRDGGINAGSTS